MAGGEDERASHVLSESQHDRRSRETRSLAWLLVLDREAGAVVGLWFVVPFSLIFLVVGIVQSTAWMIIVGSVFTLVAAGALFVRWRSRRRR